MYYKKSKENFKKTKENYKKTKENYKQRPTLAKGEGPTPRRHTQLSPAIIGSNRPWRMAVGGRRQGWIAAVPAGLRCENRKPLYFFSGMRSIRRAASVGVCRESASGAAGGPPEASCHSPICTNPRLPYAWCKSRSKISPGVKVLGLSPVHRVQK